MQFSYAALAVAALGLQCILAQPAHHRHHHKHKRGPPEAVQPREVDWNNKDLYKDVDWNKVFNIAKEQGENTTEVKAGSQPESKEEGQPAAKDESQPAPEDQSQPEPEDESQPEPEEESQTQAQEDQPTPSVEEDQPSSSVKDDKKPVQSPKSKSAGKGFGGITEPVDDGNQDHYIGNVGIPYGSNMILIDESERSNYKYTLTLTNIHKAETTYIIWNKSGIDGQPQSGMGLEPNLKFTVSPKRSQVVAFDENTQISFSRDCPRNKLGGNLPDCTWGEADFGDLRNGGWSGYDCSSIPNTKGNVDYCKMSCEGAKTSSHEYNSFTDASQTNAGGSLAPGPAAFYAEL